MDLILFYENGHTYRFKDATMFEVYDDARRIEFEYFGQSTQKRRKAVFSGFVGYTTETK